MNDIDVRKAQSWSPKVSFHGFEKLSGSAKSAAVKRNQLENEQRELLRNTITSVRDKDAFRDEQYTRQAKPVTEALAETNKKLQDGLFEEPDDDGKTKPKLDTLNENTTTQGKKTRKKINEVGADITLKLDDLFDELADGQITRGEILQELQNQNISMKNIVKATAGTPASVGLMSVNEIRQAVDSGMTGLTSKAKGDLVLKNGTEGMIWGTPVRIEGDKIVLQQKKKRIEYDLKPNLFKLMTFPTETLKRTWNEFNPVDDDIREYLEIIARGMDSGNQWSSFVGSDKAKFLKNEIGYVFPKFREIKRPEGTGAVSQSQSKRASIGHASIGGTGKAAKYRHLPSMPYTLNGNEFGALEISRNALLNKGKLKVRKGGQLVMDKQVDPSMIMLLTKRYHTRHPYSDKAKKDFRKLIGMAELPMHTNNGKWKYIIHPRPQSESEHAPIGHAPQSKLASIGMIDDSVVMVLDENDAVEKLERAVLSMQAGNDSKRTRNKIVKLLDFLLERGVIDNAYRRKIIADM